MDTEQVDIFKGAIQSLEALNPSKNNTPNAWAKLQILKARLKETIDFELSWSGQYYLYVSFDDISNFLNKDQHENI